MAKKVKKIGTNALELVAKKLHNEMDVQWEGIDIHITPTISMKSMIEFVEDVVDSCFRESGDYVPQIMDYAIQENIVTRYSNLALPNDLEKKYELLIDTEIADFICQHINQSQFREILKSIDRKLRYLSDTDVQKVRMDIANLFDAFDRMQETVSASIAKLDMDSIAKLSQSFADGNFSTDAVVKAMADNIRAKDEADA